MFGKSWLRVNRRELLTAAATTACMVGLRVLETDAAQARTAPVLALIGATMPLSFMVNGAQVGAAMLMHGGAGSCIC